MPSIQSTRKNIICSANIKPAKKLPIADCPLPIALLNSQVMPYICRSLKKYK